MKNKKIIYAITCAVGSMMVGFFAKDLGEIIGSILFTVGVVLMVSSIIKLTK